MHCYLCGSSKNLTKDHIPPKGFFPPPRPSNLITVPCCQLCNQSYSKDDEAIRTWFSMSPGDSKSAKWIFHNKSLGGTFSRSPKFTGNLLATMIDMKFTTPKGDIGLTRFSIPTDRVESFLFRCIKGLLTYYYPGYDYSKDTFRWGIISPRTDNRENTEKLCRHVEQCCNQLQYEVRGGDVFQVWRGLNGPKQFGMWILAFYGAAVFQVLHGKNQVLIS